MRPGEDGEIVFAGEATFPGYSGKKLGRLVREAVHLPVLVENDVNAAALGEAWLGAARGASSAFMITVGTNLGGCFVQQGRIWHGASFSAGEIGYLRLHNEKRILEDVASTRAMIREAAFSHNMSPSEITGEMVFDWAREGDEEAMASIEVLASNLGEGLAAVCCLLNPEVIVLGGGVMAQHEILGPLLEKRLEQLVMPAMRAKTRQRCGHARRALRTAGAGEGKKLNIREKSRPSTCECVRMAFYFCRMKESMAQDHDEAADGGYADDEDAQQAQRGEVRPLGAEPGTDHESGERLDEDREVEAAVEEIAEAAGR